MAAILKLVKKKGKKNRTRLAQAKDTNTLLGIKTAAFAPSV